MSKKIKFKLSESGLDELLNKLNILETELDKAVKESIKEVADETEIVILEKMAEPRPPYKIWREPNNFSAIDTGELANSTRIETNGNTTIISQEGDHVFNVEFGDGQYFGGYPDANKIPSGVPEHESWYNYYGAIPGSNRWDVAGNPNFSRGQYAVGQMYHGGQYIKENLSKRVQKKGRDALSKI